MVSQKEKIFFAEHLSLMIKGGIPIAEALETLRDETKSRTFKKVLNEILRRILEGESLEKAFSKYPKIFDRFFLSIISVGEKSGTLDENLRYLSLQLRKDYEMRRKVIASLIYPAIIIILALAIAFGVVFFIFPKIKEVFEAMPQEVRLPLASRMLINFATFFRKYWLTIGTGVIFATFIFKVLQRVRFIRFYFDKISLFLPLLGPIFKNLNLARFSRNSYTLLKSGLPILEVLKICGDSLPNEVYRRNLISIKSGVERGEKISSGLKKISQNFPPVFSEMVLVGEKTGSLEDSLLYLARFYEREVDSTLKNLSTILEPILLILVGTFVTFVALAVILPHFRLIEVLRGGSLK